MECTLAALIACFSWSGLYLDATTDFIRDRDPRYVESFYGENLYVMPANGNDPFLQRNMIREIGRNEREIESPYGRVSLGYEANLSNVRIDVSAFYQESMAVTDRGEVGASVRVRWFPFGGRR
jgi:hypothetical protein